MWLHLLLLLDLHRSVAEESMILRGLQQQIPEGSIACLSSEQCREKFNSMNLGGNFYTSSDYPTKGCYRKNNNNNIFFGAGGTVEEMSSTDLPGVQQRVWCDIPLPESTQSPSRLSTTEPTWSDDDSIDNATKQPTTPNPSKSPLSNCIQDDRVCFNDESCCSGICGSNGRCTSSSSPNTNTTNQPTPKQVTNTPTQQPIPEALTSEPSSIQTNKPTMQLSSDPTVSV